MMKYLENDIEITVVNEVWQYLGIKGSKLKILGEDGYPDRLFWIPGGKPLLFEFKRPGEDPRPNQIEIHNYLRQLNYQVEIHDNVADAFESIIETLETTQLSKKERKILARARRRSLVLRSRFG